MMPQRTARAAEPTPAPGPTRNPGTYALVYACESRRTLQIGRLGHLRLAPGFYVYVGSAGGPGGLAARLAYHRRPPRRPHWHIDYLKPAARLIDIWYMTGRTPREHQWARRLARAPGAVAPLPRFGASDCTCSAHLLYFADRPLPVTLRCRSRRLTTLTIAGS